MPLPRFIQIHSLHGYSAALLNRDDSGLAKRLPFGNAMRTRISSQCLKRHWRDAESVFALTAIEGAEDSYRSRDIVTKLVRGPMDGIVAEDILDAIEPVFQVAVYGKDAAKKNKRQPLLLGAPEVRFLAEKFAEIAQSAEAAGDDPEIGAAPAAEVVAQPTEAEQTQAEPQKPMTRAEKAKAAAEAFCSEKAFKETMKVMREGAALHAGLPAALFGRMVTSDTRANIDAPIHVAHAFTVHAEESESDYFAVVDDLAGNEDAGADHVSEVEINSGLFYGYVVIDVAGLVSNLTGEGRKAWLSADREMAGEVAARLAHLIAEVTPGAKKGSTAPYGYASTLLVEIGDRQPRSLSNAFRSPVKANVEAAEVALNAHLATLDANYQTQEMRRFMSLRNDARFEGAERDTMAGIAAWIRTAIQDGAI